MSTLRLDIESSSGTLFGPRLGKVSLQRDAEGSTLEILTPGLITSTSRGVVPHLSRNNVNATAAICWVHVPFESFLEVSPPTPTLQPGAHPLHKYLGFRRDQHIVSTSLRDPSDDREMPANGNGFANAYCLRGVRKVTPADWRNWVVKMQPDIVTALTDVPFTAGPHSQKRMTKSLERSSAWLSDLLQPISDTGVDTRRQRSILVHMAGGVIPTARKAFSLSLLETLYGKEAEAVKPLATLDEGVSGYTFDLVPLHKALSPTAAPIRSTHPPTLAATMAALDPHVDLPTPEASAKLVPLLHASLSPLPQHKPRIAHSAASPHEMLLLIRDVGVDLFDAHWAQRAADIGVALDFTFPAPNGGADARADLGHNLYDTRYAHDFSPFADAFGTCETNNDDKDTARTTCPCIACSPPRLGTPLRHSTVDGPYPAHAPAPFTRAYAHHLLHTHEMSAHALLAAHNLAVLDAFFAGVRVVLAARPSAFAREVERFAEAYDGGLAVWAQARAAWAEVALARGKGRMAREKEKQEQDTLGTAVEL
ncbi:hypothetical protein FA95DRAFT_852071 [Auriscalpium vulgare]|uniref:Uncharacterized protein n=1 Tax=Auriscalpium vulgare TaxID=40419 RepID=A0ACB8RAJ5_9AGAM|nr:hypothetical protein FA95DRAFT_852071 [Auriscalpium vulgare]